MTKLEKNIILSNLNLVIDINRVGSDEIDVINECLDILNKPVQEITKLDKIQCSTNISELLEWSDRLGSDEYEILGESLELLI